MVTQSVVLFLLRLDPMVINTYKRLLDIILMKSHLEVLHFEQLFSYKYSQAFFIEYFRCSRISLIDVSVACSGISFTVLSYIKSNIPLILSFFKSTLAVVCQRQQPVVNHLSTHHEMFPAECFCSMVCSLRKSDVIYVV